MGVSFGAWPGVMHDGFRRYGFMLTFLSGSRGSQQPGGDRFVVASWASRTDAVSTQYIPSWCPRGVMAAGGDAQASPTDDFLSASPTPATQIRQTSCGPPREALPVKDSGVPQGSRINMPPRVRPTSRGVIAD
ncbi:MAG: hypothetical protein ACYST6_18375 [Planctomycetota bacterium]